MERWACIDGNEAAARIAHRLSEVVAIYPITPASPMGESADAWSAAGVPNLWGSVPDVIEMQSEAGAAGAMHGALQKGALATTFTASQGLLLMLPNMFKMAGELLPGVIHVAARAVATHALSIFGDHSDVMAARTTGFAMLASSSVQEAHDFALVAHAAALRSRVPFLHFFDGFRTSHEIGKIALLEDDDLRALVDVESLHAHRRRRLTPDAPVLRGSAQNPDVFFQAREAANPFYDALAGIVADAFAALGRRCGRSYGLVDYAGHAEAERVLVMMGSGVGAAREAVDRLVANGERVGLLTVRLFRPFPAAALCEALPKSVRSVAVLDRTKEPGCLGEPLYQDVLTALAENGRPVQCRGGRYGLGSKEFTPAMARSALDALVAEAPKNHFTLGIVDDVGHTSLAWDRAFDAESECDRAVFFGMGSDGSVGAAKSSIVIIGEETNLHAQGYFVYDSKKSGAVTVSHLRFGPKPIRATYQIQAAQFVACHHFGLLERRDVVGVAADGGTLLLNTAHPPEALWERLPPRARAQIVAKRLRVYAIDADRVARAVGMAHRINTVMQPCFFALSGVLPRERAIEAIKKSIERRYGRRGRVVVQRNLEAVDSALAALREVPVPDRVESSGLDIALGATAPEGFVERVTARLLAGEGDRLPVSALPVDGTFPTGTARLEKRGLARDIPLWRPELCIDCGKCALQCPHAAVRMAVFPPEALAGAPAGFVTKSFRSRDLPDHRLVIQVAPDDCTGCGVCVEACPATSKEEVKRKALYMAPIAEHVERERRNFDFFLGLPEPDLDAVAPSTVKGSQVRRPLFEFSGACAGCGETPYLKLLTQLFGDRIVVANATGCSSIYGGNLPTTPWSVDAHGRGPAWANSLFEDNAEFGLGMAMAREHHVQEARRLLAEAAPRIGAERVREILTSPQATEREIAEQRERIRELKQRIGSAEEFAQLRTLADDLVRKSIWIVGGDGWAYDIGSAGLDHVLASGRDVNVLVLDTQVYSNTGGQASKATPRAAVAKFASSGKAIPRKDLGTMASAYGNVYVAQVALGANDQQTVKSLLEAEAWHGPSLVIAYSPCIAHGIDLSRSLHHQDLAVKTGFWPLWRYHPGIEPDQHPFQLDSRRPSVPLREFLMSEARFAMLARSDPERAERLHELAQADADERWRFYSQLADVERTIPHREGEEIAE